jgi:hypothetical protein
MDHSPAYKTAIVSGCSYIVDPAILGLLLLLSVEALSEYLMFSPEEA